MCLAIPLADIMAYRKVSFCSYPLPARCRLSSDSSLSAYTHLRGRCMLHLCSTVQSGQLLACVRTRARSLPCSCEVMERLLGPHLSHTAPCVQVARAFFSLVDVLCHNHVPELAAMDTTTFAFLLGALDAGLRALEVGLGPVSCHNSWVKTVLLSVALSWCCCCLVQTARH